MVDLMTDGLALVGQVVTFITANPLLLTSVVLGIAGFGIAVVKNAIR